MDSANISKISTQFIYWVKLYKKEHQRADVAETSVASLTEQLAAALKLIDEHDSLDKKCQRHKASKC
jgi:hypothetical protein